MTARIVLLSLAVAMSTACRPPAAKPAAGDTAAEQDRLAKRAVALAIFDIPAAERELKAAKEARYQSTEKLRHAVQTGTTELIKRDLDKAEADIPKLEAQLKADRAELAELERAGHKVTTGLH